MNYTEKLVKAIKEKGNCVCVGLDPVLEKIPLEGDPETVISEYFLALLDAYSLEGILPPVVKPNIAFYEQYGFSGLRALERVIAKAKSLGVLVLLDAKRGDIGKTSTAYAKAAFEFWGVDALTVAPYMGSDSVEPFLSYAEKGYGVYVLNRTSNAGASDFQDLICDGEMLYFKTADHIASWSKKFGSCGAVVGATYLDEMKKLGLRYVDAGASVPLLIPGVGSQGGSAPEVLECLKSVGYDLSLVLINSSSGITYAGKKDEGFVRCVKASVMALKKLISESKV